MVKRLIKTIVLVALGWPLTQAVVAEMLPDPTRPSAEAGLTVVGTTVPSGPVLQSVKITAAGRTAVINGQLLAEGDNFGDARLLSIGDGEVTLLGAEGRQTLKLFPGVEKRVKLSPQAQDLPQVKNQTKRNIEQKAP